MKLGLKKCESKETSHVYCNLGVQKRSESYLTRGNIFEFITTNFQGHLSFAVTAHNKPIRYLQSSGFKLNIRLQLFV